MAKKIPKVPRELAEIQQEYQQEAFKAGALQYQIKIMSKELDGLNDRLADINREAAARNQLNAQAKADSTEVKNG